MIELITKQSIKKKIKYIAIKLSNALFLNRV